MNDIKKAIDTLKDLSKSKKTLNAEECIPYLTSTIGLLELSSPSVDQYTTLSGFLRQHLQPLYSAHLQSTLNYAMAVLSFLHNEKIVPSLRSGDPERANLWESPASSVVSGILDYLEQHQTKKTRETVASAVYPTICAFYFTNGPGLLSSYSGNLLSNVYMLLGECVESPGGDVSKLRDHHVGSRRFGHTIAEIRNYLALESIVNLLGNIIPPVKSGNEKRTKFLQEVFDGVTFKTSKRILQTLETIKRDWTLTATKIIHVLAESDIRFPQPFQVFRFQVESMLMSTSDPIFVDNKSFVASLDQGGRVETLVIPFTTVDTVTISALNGSEIKVELLINKAPLLGNNPMSLPQRGTYSASFSVVKSSVNNFAKAMKERKLVGTSCLGLFQAPSELLPEIVTSEDNKKWDAKATKLTNMAKHGVSDPGDQDNFATSSSRAGQSKFSNLDDHQDHSTFVNVSSDNLPSTVFLDPNGNFSIHPPRPTNLDHAHTITEPNNLSPKHHRDDSEDEEIPSQPRRNLKSTTQTIVLSDDEDERPSSPEVAASKQKTGTRKKAEAEQILLPMVLKTDGIASRQTKKLTTGIMDDHSRNPRAKTSNETKKSNVSKKRTLQDDASDVEVPAAKRVRQDLDSVPPSPVAPPTQRQTEYGRKSLHVTFASPIKANSGIDVDFDEIPKPKQTRAKAMKGKDGKVAPKPRPVATKKTRRQDENAKVVQRKAYIKVDDADETLVEQTEQMESHGIKAKVGRSAKHANAQAAVEVTVEVTVGFDPIDDFPPNIEQPSSDIVNETENDDLPLHDEGILEDSHVELLERLKSETPSEPPPSPPAPAQPSEVWIDLTNSPEPVETTKPTPLKPAIRKTASFDRYHSEFVEAREVPSVHEDHALHTKKIGKARRTVEKLPLPRLPSDDSKSVSSTPPRAKDAASTKIRKFSSPIRVHRLPLGSGKQRPAHKTAQATGRNMEEEQIRSPKEQQAGSSGSSRKPCGPEVEEDPDLRIAAVLGEIHKVLAGNIRNRFTGFSSDLLRVKKELKAQVARELGKMNHELFKQYNNLVELHEGYVFHTTRLSNTLEVYEKAIADSAQSYPDMLKDFKRNSFRNKLPKDIVKESTLAAIMNIEI